MDFMEYGTVISNFEGPNTRKFSFVINPGAKVRRGQFVQLSTDEGKLIGRVADILKANRYFAQPESVKEYESSGKPMHDIFPVGDWEYLVAEVSSLGVCDGNCFSESLVPPSPGTKVGEPEDRVLEILFGLDKNGIGLGNVAHHSLEARLNITRLLQKHLAILAISGAGKSYLTSVLIEELLDRKPEQGQIAVVVIDTHGEYTSFADDPGYSAKTKIFDVADIRIGLGSLSHHQLRSYMPGMSGPQLRELSKIMRGLKGKRYSLKELAETIEGNEEIKAQTKEVLLSNIYELMELGIFSLEDYPRTSELAMQGWLSVVDLSGTINERKKQIVVSYLAKKLFDARRNDSIPPFTLIVEEAHNFAPETAKKEEALAKWVITTIAREGRKFNAGLCLVSQRPVQLATTALSQCNTHIIMKVTNPYDLKHIGESCEGLTGDVMGKVSTLPVGSGLIVGEAVNFPLFVKIRKRKSLPSSRGLPLDKAALEYLNKSRQEKKDAKSFM
jgi:DNA helicase HerA-like ATPase